MPNKSLTHQRQAFVLYFEGIRNVLQTPRAKRARSLGERSGGPFDRQRRESRRAAKLERQIQRAPEEQHSRKEAGEEKPDASASGFCFILRRDSKRPPNSARIKQKNQILDTSPFCIFLPKATKNIYESQNGGQI